MWIKPLFLPLRAKWFEAFERGEKDTKYRVDGPRWNEKPCPPRRAVVLSCGYGKHRRLIGTVFRSERTDPLPAFIGTFGEGTELARFVGTGFPD